MACFIVEYFVKPVVISAESIASKVPGKPQLKESTSTARITLICSRHKVPAQSLGKVASFEESICHRFKYPRISLICATQNKWSIVWIIGQPPEPS